ncbi:hypothetical protein OHA40_32570 [Nocardia sp. NBC_00508]|uniref:hypothetical protein n=1 Tax=Nocardia sp. NBC_00508 TaxID=2975992 RepID=UPI002E809DFF|nr:hypothetical protein [Nocardia sp. NBC_00508]WUD66237.1 hypothetical protein OHA40_32570 [Nocardia sp. NBC_00508]
MVLAAAGMLDRLLLGVFICVGIALGSVNAWLTRVAVGWISCDTGSGKQRLTATTGLRLFGVTTVALIVGVLTRPDGLGIFFGLLAFQIALLLRVAAPVLRAGR